MPPPGLPRDLPRALGAGRPRARARCSRAASSKGDRVGDLGAEPLRVGRDAVRDRPHRRDPRHHQPRLQGGRARATRSSKAGVSLLVLARGFRDADYVGDARARSAADCPELREAIVLEDDWEALPGRRRRASSDAELAEREASLQFDDPINIQYTSGTTGLPQGRDALAPQHPQQRVLHRRATLRYTERDRVCVPVPFYHCFGMVLGNLALHHPRRLHGRARRGVRPAAVLETVAGRALHVALRRADDVHRRARPTRASSASTSRACAPGSWPARRARSR